jgi:non-ribosomal peptide synthetase component E (peptide arylation enzyme)
MIPSRTFALKSMPLNSNGKVDRKALRQILEDRIE